MVGFPQGSIISPTAWLIQTSLTFFHFDKNENVITKNNQNISKITTRCFADDTLQKISFAIDKNTSDREKFEIIDKGLNETLNVFEKCVVKTGGILNGKKTEKLFHMKNETLGIKNTTRWLGISLKMTKFGLESDVAKTVTDIRIKTLPGFVHICALSSDVNLRRRVFQIYIEPIIAYHLVTLMMTKRYKKSLEDFKTLQNNFLRKIAKVGYYADVKEMHEILGIWTIEDKLYRLADNLWSRIKIEKDYVPKFETIETREGIKTIVKIKNPEDRVYSLKLKYTKNKSKRKKFVMKDFEKWQKEMWKRGQDKAINV